MASLMEERLEKTNEMTAGGEQIYIDPNSKDKYYKDTYGEHQMYAKGQASHSSGSGSNAGGGSKLLLILIALSAGVGLWLENQLSSGLYRFLSIALPALLLVLPFVNEKIGKRPKVINILLAITVYIFIAPVVDSFTGASDADFVYLALLFNAYIAGAISYGVYKVVTSVQRKYIRSKSSNNRVSDTTSSKGVSIEKKNDPNPQWELDGYKDQILWRSKICDTAIAYVGFSNPDPYGVMKPDRLYPSVCHRYKNESGELQECYFPIHEIVSVNIGNETVNNGVKWVPLEFGHKNGSTLFLHLTNTEFVEFYNVFKPIHTPGLAEVVNTVHQK